MADNSVTSNVTLSLHPSNIENIEGYNEDTRLYVSHVVTAFSAAYMGIDDIHKARAKAATNPSWTEAQQLLNVAKFAELHQEKITRKFDQVRKTLTTQIDAIESMLTTPLKHAAERPGIASEIRAHFKSLSNEQRWTALEDAQKEGQTEVLQAVLGSPGMLSGMNENERAVRTRLYHENQNPVISNRLKVMRAAKEMMEQRGGLVFGEVSKAIGADWRKIQKLREANTAAEQAFIVKDRTVDMSA